MLVCGYCKYNICVKRLKTDHMKNSTNVKILKFHPEKCDGGLACERACSKVHFESDEGGNKSAIRILKDGNSYGMHVCDQRGLCLDMCPVGARTRR